MKTPRFFTGAVLLFWGWQVHLFWLGLCLALILESARMAKIRFELEPSDFNKFVDISTVFLAGTVVLALTIEAQKAGLMILKWLPLIFFPVIAAQEFSTKGRMDVKSFFLAARKKVEIRFYETKEIDVSYIYGFLCIMSAASANTKTYLFFSGAALFFIWGLWPVRSGRIPVSGWIICMLVVTGLGFAGQSLIRDAGRAVSKKIMSYYVNYYNANPFKSYTALGEIGDLKLSEKIVLRVFPDDYRPGKRYLLHSTTYNRFADSNWYSKFLFEPVEASIDKTFWQVNPKTDSVRKMTVYFRLLKGKAVLTLPPGVIDISEMKAGECEKNAVQVVRIQEGPPLIKAVVSHTGAYTHDALPDEEDLRVSPKELPVIAEFSRKLGLENKSHEEILKTVHDFFMSGFGYSLELQGKGERSTPLENFLYHTRAGHCEIFATATVLLLRQAGLPARYATGLIAHEYSTLEQGLIVRWRDAHAWAKVFVNGQWQNLDTTPPSFLSLDRKNIRSSGMEDFFSFLGFKLSRLRHETGAKFMEQHGFWLVLPLGLILFLRLKRSNQIRRAEDAGLPRQERKEKVEEPAFYRIEQILSGKGYPRYVHETYASWLKRIGHHLDNDDLTGHLLLVLAHHNQWRFGKPEQKKGLKEKLEKEVAGLSDRLTV